MKSFAFVFLVCIFVNGPTALASTVLCRDSAAAEGRLNISVTFANGRGHESLMGYITRKAESDSGPSLSRDAQAVLAIAETGFGWDGTGKKLALQVTLGDPSVTRVGLGTPSPAALRFRYPLTFFGFSDEPAIYIVAPEDSAKFDLDRFRAAWVSGVARYVYFEYAKSIGHRGRLFPPPFLIETEGRLTDPLEALFMRIDRQLARRGELRASHVEHLSAFLLDCLIAGRARLTPPIAPDDAFMRLAELSRLRQTEYVLSDRLGRFRGMSPAIAAVESRAGSRVGPELILAQAMDTVLRETIRRADLASRNGLQMPAELRRRYEARHGLGRDERAQLSADLEKFLMTSFEADDMQPVAEDLDSVLSTALGR